MSRHKVSAVQSKAITCGNGPVRVLAGPGSGKTFTIIQRILYLIRKKGVAPKEILTVTFTKAAAKEMQQRYLAELKQEGIQIPSDENVSFGTLHGICYHILNSSGSFSRFSLIQEYEKRTIAEIVLRNTGLFQASFCENNLSDVITDFLDAVSRFKNGLSIAAPLETIPMEKLISEYQSYLSAKQLLDFDDMILKCLTILQSNSSLQKSWQNRFRYLLVDEFQDINEMQYQVLKLLAFPWQNLFVVGDDDQSIYGFRGAFPCIMEQFLLDFPSASSFLLNENYRCAKEIATLSQKVIAGNENRIKKELSASKDGGCVTWFYAENRKEEEKKLVSEIKGLAIAQQSNCAVIVRTNREAGLYASLLKRNGIPVWEKRKGRDIFHHFILEDICAFLCFLREGRKRKDFMKFMQRSELFLSPHALTEEVVTKEGLLCYYQRHPLMQDKIKKLFDHFDTAASFQPHLAVRYFCKIMGYEEAVKKQKNYGGNQEEAQEDILPVLQEIQQLFCTMGKEEAVKEFLKRKEREYRQKEDLPHGKGKAHDGDIVWKCAEGVHILTMHGAKGLEFDTVFLPDLNEGVIPGRNCKTKEEKEEERRLLYVAITRAENHLFLYYTGERNRQLSSLLTAVLPHRQ